MRNETTNVLHGEPPHAQPITEEFRLAAEKSELPDLPAEAWERGFRFHDVYRLLKRGVRLDEDILAWLKSAGPGYGERANQILRERMLSEMQGKQGR